MRWKIVSLFDQNIGPLRDEIKKVALVGGLYNDPEVRILEKYGITDIDFFGIERDKGIDRFEVLDLNTLSESVKKYDLACAPKYLSTSRTSRMRLKTWRGLLNLVEGYG